LTESSLVWKPAPLGKIKLNVDVAFVKENYTGAIGVVACNSNCIFIWVVCSWLPNVGSTLEAEAEAVRMVV
jgi:hypothetical protein